MGGMEQEEHGDLAEAYCRRGLRNLQDGRTHNSRCSIDRQELVEVASSTIFIFKSVGKAGGGGHL